MHNGDAGERAGHASERASGRLRRGRPRTSSAAAVNLKPTAGAGAWPQAPAGAARRRRRRAPAPVANKLALAVSFKLTAAVEDVQGRPRLRRPLARSLACPARSPASPLCTSHALDARPRRRCGTPCCHVFAGAQYSTAGKMPKASYQILLNGTSMLLHGK